MKLSGVFFIIICFIGCVKDRTFDIVPSAADEKITSGTLFINEFVAKGSELQSEFGDSTDWVEIFNPGADTIFMTAGKWFMTDSLAAPYKYQLPSGEIAPHGFLIVRCDSRDTVVTQIHTNFNLSANGEDIGLFYKTDAGPFFKVDSYTFGAQTSGLSTGRKPDGSQNWGICTYPTPGSPNM